MKRKTLARMAAVVTIGAVSACGNDGSGGSSAPSTSTSTGTSSTSTPTTSTPTDSTSTTPSSPPTSSGGRGASETVRGKVVGRGTTCVVLRTDDGKSYSLTGQVPAQARQTARARLETLPVAVTGHQDAKAVSPCHLPVFVATKVVVRPA